MSALRFSRIAWLLFPAVLLSSCGFFAREERAPFDPIKVYKEGIQRGRESVVKKVKEELKQKEAFGHTKPYAPVRLPPDVRKVWVVSHAANNGVMVQGHWVFLVVRKERWAARSFPPLVSSSSRAAQRTVIPTIDVSGGRRRTGPRRARSGAGTHGRGTPASAGGAGG